MSKKYLSNVLVGLLALMVSIMLILDILIDLPSTVKECFYYINIIVWFIFLLDYIIRVSISKYRISFNIKNIIDLLSLLTINMYIYFFRNITIIWNIDIILVVNLLKVVKLSILLMKFYFRVKEELRVNSVSFMLILTTIVIVVGAVLISLLEHMTFEDALWWSFVTFTTVGYGDVILRTNIGRVVAVVLMIFGIGFIGITTSTLAARIINCSKYNKKDMDFKREIIENVKEKIDNIDKLSDKEIEVIYKVLKSLKDSKK